MVPRYGNVGEVGVDTGRRQATGGLERVPVLAVSAAGETVAAVLLGIQGCTSRVAGG